MEQTKATIREGSKVAVIGGAGFLGSHLVQHLIDDRGCEVLVLDNLISGRLDFIHEKATFQWADITGSESQLRKTFEAHEIEYVFNYAAEPYIPVSFERPIHTFNVNAFGALKVMNACVDAGVKRILQVSSAEIYGDIDGKIKESDPATPHSTYGAAKLAIDMLVQCRWREAQVPAIAMRQFNCYGERETHPYVIPEIISQLSESNVVYLGNNSFRDFQYAGDAVKMAVDLLENGELGEVYNMGSEEGIQIYDLAKKIGELMGWSETEIKEDETRRRPWEIWHLQSDNTKLYSTITTRPEVSFDTGLRRTIDDFNLRGWVW